MNFEKICGEKPMRSMPYAQSHATALSASAIRYKGMQPRNTPPQREAAPATSAHWFVVLNSQDGTTVGEALVGCISKDIGN
ncbi:hypothetical protein [Ralstonia sp. UBA689]|uniref:hypothetical protein n=1 Tax=Ralstonia sp. UBA689 TaxID=1947373 RepID=UPI0025F6D366|nr:hypothetical protein [Ralstonia sp. UBA689]